MGGPGCAVVGLGRTAQDRVAGSGSEDAERIGGGVRCVSGQGRVAGCVPPDMIGDDGGMPCGMPVDQVPFRCRAPERCAPRRNG